MLVLANLNASAQRHTEEIMKVGDYMRSRKFPPALQQKVFDFTEAEWKRMQGYDEREIMAHLPAALQIEVARHLHAKMLRTVSFFQGSHAGFINEVVLALHTTMLLPGSVLRATHACCELSARVSAIAIIRSFVFLLCVPSIVCWLLAP